MSKQKQRNRQKNKQTPEVENKVVASEVLLFNQHTPAISKLWLYGLAFALFIPTLIAPMFTQYGYSPDLHMSFTIQVCMLTLLSLFLISHRNRKEIALVKNPLILPIFLFYGWAFISIFWAYNRFESMISLLDWGAGIITFLLVSNALRKPEDTKLIIHAIFMTGILLAFLGWNQYLLGVDWVQQHAPPSATFNNKNMAAQYGVLVMPLGIGLFLSAQKRLEYWLYALGTMLIFVFVMYTFTRNTYLNFTGILAALILLLVLNRFYGHRLNFPKEKIFVFFFACFLALFSLMWNKTGWIGLEYFDHLFGRFNTIGTEARLDGKGIPRVAMWFNSLEMIKDHFITGVGIGNWMVYYPVYQTSAIIDFEMSESVQHINAHNDYVEILSDLGIIGLGLLMLLCFTLFRTGLKTFFGHIDNPNRFIVLGVMLGCVGIGINAFFSFPFKQPAPIMVFCAYLGILANEYARVNNTKLWQFPGGSKALATGLVTSVVMVSAFALHYQWNQSEIHFRKATILSRNDNPHMMIQEGQKSYDALPLRSRMLNFVGMGHLRTGNTKGAAEALESVKAAYPNRNNTLQNLGFIYMELAEDARRKNNVEEYAHYLNKAKENFAHFVSIRPDSHRGHRNLGVAHSRLNETKEAHRHLATSVALLQADNGTPDPRIVDLIKQLEQKIKDNPA